MAGGLAFLAGKGKYLLAALKVTKLAWLGSLLFPIGPSSMSFGFPFAVGFVGLTLILECGHALVSTPIQYCAVQRVWA